MAAVVSLSEAQESLRTWVKAREALASGSSYSIGGRTLTRQDSDTVEANIQRWHNTVTTLEARAKGQSRSLGAQAVFERPGARSGGAGIIPSDLWTDWRT